MTLKKILTVMTVALSALVLAGSAFAADTVGTIDTQKSCSSTRNSSRCSARFAT